jgi:hypothetical protein
VGAFVSVADLSGGWATLDRLAVGEYGHPLDHVLNDSDEDLALRRVGRLFGVYLKEPFARSFDYDRNSPSNWAKSKRFWEIHEDPSAKLVAEHGPQYDVLEQVAWDWQRPIEYVAEFNVFVWLCKRFSPIVCGEAKALENAEKIAKDLEKKGFDASALSLNQGIGIAAVTLASHLGQAVPELADHSPIVTGATLLLLCFGQRKVCHFMTTFQSSYDKEKDRFAIREFFVCGSESTRDGRPCRALVRSAGRRCARHA